MTPATRYIDLTGYSTIEDAVEGLKEHLSKKHEDPVNSARQLDILTFDIFYKLLDASVSEDETNHILGLYGKAMEIILGYESQGNGGEAFGKYAEAINMRFEGLTDLKHGLTPVIDRSTSHLTIQANIVLAREYLDPSEELLDDSGELILL